MGKFFIISVFLFCLTACQTEQSDLDRLVDYMSGSFRSAEQAQRDTSFLDISLHMVPIWPDQADGHWLYVEQALGARDKQPYRQRVYHLTQVNDSTFRSNVYTIPDPMRFAGAWQEEDPLAGLTPDSLELRDGCAVLLQKQAENIFVGMTESLRCSSDLRGADYATSIVLITPTEMYSWDRGFDMAGNQVWGAEKGGYVFKKN